MRRIMHKCSYVSLFPCKDKANSELRCSIKIKWLGVTACQNINFLSHYVQQVPQDYDAQLYRTCSIYRTQKCQDYPRIVAF